MNLLIATTLFSFFTSSPNKLAPAAESWEGKHFKQGQTARCADFVGTVVKSVGKQPPSGYQKCTSWLGWGSKISLDKIQKGDIVIYSKSGGYNHIGIYVGDGQIIHRPTRSKTVRKINYKYRSIIGVRRA